nr:MAG TPA: ERF superfamily protein [Caudoviricetes sp.]
MNIYEKMSAIMQDVQYLTKDDQVKFGTTSYKALSEEKVTGIMRAELIKHKLVIYPIQQSASRIGQITHVDVMYRLVNVENPEEYIDIASCGDGADSQDKGSGKAMTYAFKYMWLRAFALPTGEDPDKISSAELDEKLKYVCADCGIPISNTKTRSGEIWKADKIAAYAEQRHHRVLCPDCIKVADKVMDKVQ